MVTPVDNLHAAFLAWAPGPDSADEAVALAGAGLGRGATGGAGTQQLSAAAAERIWQAGKGNAAATAAALAACGDRSFVAEVASRDRRVTILKAAVGHRALDADEAQRIAARADNDTVWAALASRVAQWPVDVELVRYITAVTQPSALAWVDLGVAVAADSRLDAGCAQALVRWHYEVDRVLAGRTDLAGLGIADVLAWPDVNHPETRAGHGPRYETAAVVARRPDLVSLGGELVDSLIDTGDWEVHWLLSGRHDLDPVDYRRLGAAGRAGDRLGDNPFVPLDALIGLGAHQQHAAAVARVLGDRFGDRADIFETALRLLPSHRPDDAPTIAAFADIVDQLCSHH